MFRTYPRKLGAGLAVTALLMTACGDDDDTASTTAEQAAPATTAAAPGTSASPDTTMAPGTTDGTGHDHGTRHHHAPGNDRAERGSVRRREWRRHTARRSHLAAPRARVPGRSGDCDRSRRRWRHGSARPYKPPSPRWTTTRWRCRRRLARSTATRPASSSSSLWRAHIGFFVDYTLGAATGDMAAAGRGESQARRLPGRLRRLHRQRDRR